MTMRAAILLLLTAFVVAGCGRKAAPDFPEGARTDAPTLPRKGEPVLYPY